MARQTKTERQRAEEALGVAERHVVRLTKERDRLDAQLRTVKAALRDATALRDYRRQHPALSSEHRLHQPDTNPEENTAP